MLSTPIIKGSHLSYMDATLKSLLDPKTISQSLPSKTNKHRVMSLNTIRKGCMKNDIITEHYLILPFLDPSSLCLHLLPYIPESTSLNHLSSCGLNQPNLTFPWPWRVRHKNLDIPSREKVKPIEILQLCYPILFGPFSFLIFIHVTLVTAHAKKDLPVIRNGNVALPNNS